ncbi:MAG: PilN domain-containing protein [Bacillota bacterium]
MRVNLAQEEKIDFSFSWLRTAGIIIICAVLLGIGVDFYMFNAEKRGLEGELANIEEEMKVYEPRRSQAENLEREISLMEEELDRTFMDYYWDVALEEIGYLVPESTMVEYMNIEEEELEFGGITSRSEHLLTLIDNLEVSDNYQNTVLQEVSKQDDVNFVFEALLSEGGN